MPSLKKIFRSFAGQKTKYALPEADEAYDFEYHRSVKSKIKTALNGSAKTEYEQTLLAFWRKATLNTIDDRCPPNPAAIAEDNNGKEQE
ncbi:MAG: hypothetical protein LQ351_003474 [Letrouitia transgressa]|nr:MAG: hypothetical protein LQ351_003474 [Letrouitia transgressa]